MVVKVLKISIYLWESDDAGQLLSLPCFGVPHYVVRKRNDGFQSGDDNYR